MYDALIGRSDSTDRWKRTSSLMDVPPPPSKDPEVTQRKLLSEDRPLSVSSITSSSSSSSSSGSNSLSRRLGPPKSSPYLASIESLDDDELSDDEEPTHAPATQRAQNKSRCDAHNRKSAGSGSGDSGVCSPCSYISSPSPPQGKPKYCDPNLSYMDRVVMEIVETEGVYVKDLQEIIEGYLHRWQACEHCPIEKQQVNELFSNIEAIYRFNSAFLQELEQCGMDPVKVARTFVKHNNGFSIYTDYCTNYPRTVSVLTELMRQETTVRLFRERQSALQHTLPLGSYLLKPVQRILKYHLLLQNIVKHYPREANGYNDIVDALSTMTGIAHHINEMKRRHEHAVRVQEIQSLLYGWEGEDLTTFGELCAEGTFRMYGAKALRHVFLFDKMLLITKKKEEGILSYKTHIMCSNLMLIESVPREPLSFHVIPFDNPRLQYTLQARNLEQKREWTLQLKRVILENYNAVIPSHARQLVMELGQNRTDDEIMADKGTPKRQHSAPEYLEKRKQERERRKSETGLRSKLRRSRKAEIGSPKESPMSHRRGRRASSSSRDRSGSRTRSGSHERDNHRKEDSPVASSKSKERFIAWRRKSEPNCYTSTTNLPLKLSLSPGIPEKSIAAPTPCDSTIENSIQEDDDGGDYVSVVEEKVQELKPSETHNKCNAELINGEQSGARKETLEEIVGQLVMQNREFQRILKKQRHVTLRRALAQVNQRYEETTDTENEDSIYETLIIPKSYPTYRGHRQAHMRALQNEQKAFVENPDSMEDYVTLTYNTSKENICQNKLNELSATNPVSAVRESDKFFQDHIFVTANGETCVTTPTITTSCAKLNSIQMSSTSGDKSVPNFKSYLGYSDTHVPVKASSSSSGVGMGPFGNYDNLQHIWDSVNKSQARKPAFELSETTTTINTVCKTLSLRRTQSFSCGENEGDTTPTITKQAPITSTVILSLPSETNIPTLPAVWLKQQGEHLATPNKKSGSLPRSFQMTQEIPVPNGYVIEETQDGSYRPRYRDGKSCDRPFTIASDKPGPAEINFEDIEQYIQESTSHRHPYRFPINPDDTEDSTTEYTGTPNVSMDNINVHPEYKIYRPSVSRASLKHVIASVSNKLAGFKVSAGTSTETIGSYSNMNSDTETEKDQLRVERRTSRLVYALARQYSKTLKQRIRNIMGDEKESDCETSTSTYASLPIYKQGSSSLGARIAQCSESSEYANPKQLYATVEPKHARNFEVRPDSVLSVSSNFTSSSDGDKTSGFGGSIDTTAAVDDIVESPVTRKCRKLKPDDAKVDDNINESDGSGDSFYERSFEAIESILEHEMFRDSAIFSDHDETESFSAVNQYIIPPNSISRTNCTSPRMSYSPKLKPRRTVKIPPPVPAKPNPSQRLNAVKGNSIMQKLKTLEESSKYQKDDQQGAAFQGMKSIQERRRELELWRSGSREDECETSSQHSTSTVIEVCLGKSNNYSPTSPNCSESSTNENSEQTSENEGCAIPASGTPRGWVRHVIGKLQGDNNVQKNG